MTVSRVFYQEEPLDSAVFRSSRNDSSSSSNSISNMADPRDSSDPVADEEEEDEPLICVEELLDDAVLGEDDTFRTQNASVNDWERRNVVERTQGSIHTRVDLMDVAHGTLDDENEDENEATLMVFRFRFDPQKNSRRVTHAAINIEFFATSSGDSGPTVEAISPEQRWTVQPTTDQESTTRGADLTLGASGAPFVTASGTAKLERTVSRDISDATTITGSINLGTGRNSGDSTAAAWNIRENKRRQTGVPDSVTVVVLLRREDDEPFNAVVTLEAEVDFKTGLEQKFRKLPLDDPVLFNPKKTGKKPKKGRRYGVENLGKVDLSTLCEVRMGVEAPFAAGKP